MAFVCKEPEQSRTFQLKKMFRLYERGALIMDISENINRELNRRIRRMQWCY